MVFVVEDGTGKTDSNSYCNLAYASSYFTIHPFYASAWQALSSAEQENALMYATQTLDEWVNWKGSRATEDQRLRWPRYGVVDRDGYLVDSNIVPRPIKDAASELAYLIQATNLSAEPDTKGFSSIRVGPIGLTIDKSDRDATTVLPDSVRVIVEAYGRIRTRGGARTVPMVRT